MLLEGRVLCERLSTSFVGAIEINGLGFKLTKTVPDCVGESGAGAPHGSGGRRPSTGCTQDRFRSPLRPSSGLLRASSRS